MTRLTLHRCDGKSPLCWKPECNLHSSFYGSLLSGSSREVCKTRSQTQIGLLGLDGLFCCLTDAKRAGSLSAFGKCGVKLVYITHMLLLPLHFHFLLFPDSLQWPWNGYSQGEIGWTSRVWLLPAWKQAALPLMFGLNDLLEVKLNHMVVWLCDYPTNDYPNMIDRDASAAVPSLACWCFVQSCSLTEMFVSWRVLSHLCLVTLKLSYSLITWL